MVITFLWHLELHVRSSFLHLQILVLHLLQHVPLNTPCPPFIMWSLAASLTAHCSVTNAMQCKEIMQQTNKPTQQSNTQRSLSSQKILQYIWTIAHCHCTLHCKSYNAIIALQKWHCTLHYTMCCTSVAQTKVTTHVGAYPCPQTCLFKLRQPLSLSIFWVGESLSKFSKLAS